jgi:hypothetical protein
LEHGLPQGAVVRVMRQVRPQLEAAHDQSLKKDPAILFDQQAIRAQAKPGMIATDNTDPVFLVFVRLTDSSVGNQKDGTAVAVCLGPAELGEFLRRHSALAWERRFSSLCVLCIRWLPTFRRPAPLSAGEEQPDLLWQISANNA